MGFFLFIILILLLIYIISSLRRKILKNRSLRSGSCSAQGVCHGGSGKSSSALPPTVPPAHGLPPGHIPHPHSHPHEDILNGYVKGSNQQKAKLSTIALT